MEFSITAAASEHPRRVALIADGEELTYQEAAHRTQPIVSWLRARGVGERSRVALVAAHRLESVLLLYALFEIGATVVLIHPRLTATERAHLVDDSSPVLVLDETWHVPTEGAVVASEVPTASPSPVPADKRPLAIVYTSGSSGAPKGAILSRAAFLASARASAQNLGWYEEDRWVLPGPAAHVGGLSVVTRCLIARACLVLTRGPKFSSVDAVCDAITRHRATLVSLPPPLLDAILKREPPWTFPPHLRGVLMGSMAASPDLLARARARNAPVAVTYGFTEACSQVATQKLGTPPGVEQGCGHPVPGTEIRIVDGEVQVRGPTLLTDYFPPGRCARPVTEDGWFRTGDLGDFDDVGRLHLRGRKTDRLITGGENVDPLEVEHALECAPGIAGALVFGIPDDVWGQCIAAALVAPEPPTDDALASYLAERLADFKRPRYIVYVSELPATVGGKPDRRAAAATLASSLRPIARAK